MRARKPSPRLLSTPHALASGTVIRDPKSQRMVTNSRGDVDRPAVGARRDGVAHGVFDERLQHEQRDVRGQRVGIERLPHAQPIAQPQPFE